MKNLSQIKVCIKQCFLLLYSCLFFTTCQGKPSQKPLVVDSPSPRDSVIHFNPTSDKTRKVYLSEIADSITYLPLETNSKCLIGNPVFTFTPSYIICYNKVFDWNGKFLFNVGKSGQGKGEEAAFLVATCNNSNFYTLGYKIIQYDLSGKYTGKERVIYRVPEKNTLQTYDLSYQTDGFGLGEMLLVYKYPDSLYWINSDLEITHRQRVIPPVKKLMIPGIGDSLFKFYFTFSLTGANYYNYFNDTIYSIKDTGLQPEWIIDLGKDKMPEEITLTRNFELIKGALTAIKSGGIPAVEGTEYIKLSDGKINIESVYETSRYIFINWVRFYGFAELRKLKPMVLQTAYYNKDTRQLTFPEDRFIEDFYGGPLFKPSWCGINNKLISSVLPAELKDYVEEQQKSGKHISPVLLDIANKSKEDDNPIMIIVHLKR